MPILPKPFRSGIPSLDVLLGEVKERKTNSSTPAVQASATPEPGGTAPAIAAANASGSPKTATARGVLPPAAANRIERLGIELLSFSHTTSLALIGPDGTGKSVIAMHFASRYKADNPAARVCYVSTDLIWEKANQVWEEFALNKPDERTIPFACAFCIDAVCGGGGCFLPCNSSPKLTPCHAHDGSMEQHMQGSSPNIGFVDLAAHTAGDDWGYLCRLVSVLDTPAEGPRNLLVIDAMEGFEISDGDTDAYGEPIRRRSRVAQIMRLAAGKCHVILVV